MLASFLNPFEFHPFRDLSAILGLMFWAVLVCIAVVVGFIVAGFIRSQWRKFKGP